MVFTWSQYDSSRPLSVQHGTRRLWYNRCQEAWCSSPTTQINHLPLHSQSAHTHILLSAYVFNLSGAYGSWGFDVSTFGVYFSFDICNTIFALWLFFEPFGEIFTVDSPLALRDHIIPFLISLILHRVLIISVDTYSVSSSRLRICDFLVISDTFTSTLLPHLILLFLLLRQPRWHHFDLSKVLFLSFFFVLFSFVLLLSCGYLICFSRFFPRRYGIDGTEFTAWDAWTDTRRLRPSDLTVAIARLLPRKYLLSYSYSFSYILVYCILG